MAESILKREIGIEKQVDDFLDQTSASGLLCKSIVQESYRDWLVDQRKERKRKGIWKEANNPREFPIGNPNEELIMGQRAWRKYKDYFCVKRRYHPKPPP